jgi:hypothetical protein
MTEIFVCDYETRTKYPLTIDANTTLGQLKQMFADLKKDVNIKAEELCTACLYKTGSRVSFRDCTWSKYPLIDDDKTLEEYSQSVDWHYKGSTIFMATEWTEYMQVLLPYYKNNLLTVQ